MSNFVVRHEPFSIVKKVFDINEQNQSTSSKIVAGLERISEAFRVLLWEQAKAFGLSPIQIQILIFIRYHGPGLANVSHLAREFNVTKPTISDAVKALRQKELIKQQTSEHDRRAYTVILTPKGKKVISETERFAAPMKTIIEKLPLEEQSTFFSYLNKVIFNLNRTGVLTVQRMCFNCQFYRKKNTHHYCALMEIDLHDQDLRIDCPEYEEKKQ